MKYILGILLLVTGLIVSGCMSYRVAGKSDNMYGAALADDVAFEAADYEESDRMLIWTGSLTLEVQSVTNAAQRAKALTKTIGGYVESTAYSDGQNNYYEEAPSVTMTLRIPSDKLDSAIGSLEQLGEVKSKSISSTDVTEKYVDTQARLETKKQLRDRLQQLLDKAEEVKDIVAIEKELNRLQADIDSMTARLKSLKGKVDYAALTVRIQAQKKEKVLGPLGYVWEGTKWIVKKLFVWRDEGYVEQESPYKPVVINPSDSAILNHIVYPGESIEDIAKMYGTSVAEIRTLNTMKGNENVHDGQRIVIPVRM